MSKLLFGLSWASEPVQLTDDVKQREQKKAKRPLNNDETPARASEIKKNCHKLLRRGKSTILSLCELFKK